MSLISEAERGYKLHEKLVSMIRVTKFSFIQAGKLLCQLEKGNLFKKAIGEGVDDWEAYLRQPELGLSKGEATRLMQIYQTFVVKYGYTEKEVSEIPIKNLHYLLPLAKKEDSQEVRDLIDDAKVLHQTDFRVKVANYKYADEERTYEYLIMKRCVEDGTMTKIHGIGSEDISNFIQNHGETQKRKK